MLVVWFICQLRSLANAQKPTPLLLSGFADALTLPPSLLCCPVRFHRLLVTSATYRRNSLQGG
jgi:hypothetical protein